MGHFRRPDEEDKTQGGPLEFIQQGREPEFIQQGRRTQGCLVKMEGKQNKHRRMWKRKSEENKPFSMSGVGNQWATGGRLALDIRETF